MRNLVLELFSRSMEFFSRSLGLFGRSLELLSRSLELFHFDESASRGYKEGKPVDRASWPDQAGGPTRQVGQQGRRAESIDVPALTANIFVGGTNRTNIRNKTCSMHH
jgi:hypothetical protein